MADGQLICCPVDHHREPARQGLDGHRAIGLVFLEGTTRFEGEDQQRERASTKQCDLPMTSDRMMRLLP